VPNARCLRSCSSILGSIATRQPRSERKSYAELVKQSPPGVGEVRAERSELTPSHSNASNMLVEAGCQRRKVGRRSEAGLEPESGPRAVEVLQE
jgi:hypothetical protein